MKLRKRIFWWLLEMPPQVKIYIILCHQNEAVCMSLKTPQESFLERLVDCAEKFVDCAVGEKYSAHFPRVAPAPNPSFFRF